MPSLKKVLAYCDAANEADEYCIHKHCACATYPDGPCSDELLSEFPSCIWCGEVFDHEVVRGHLGESYCSTDCMIIAARYNQQPTQETTR